MMFSKTSRSILFMLACLAVTAPAAAAPDEAARYYEDAIAQFDREAYKAAIIQLKNALKHDPNHLPARVLLGRAQLHYGDSPAAEKEIRLAQKLGADPSLTLITLAKALSNQHKYQEVVEQISADGLDPQLAVEVQFERGNAHLELGDFAPAKAEFEQALALAPTAPLPKIGLAALELRQGRYDTAATLVDEVLRQYPANPDAWNTKAAIAYARGDRDEAVHHYERTLILAPNYYSARISRASALMDLGRFSDALRELRNLRKTSAWDPQVSYLLAVALDQTGDAEAAKTEMGHAAEMINAAKPEVLTRHLPTLLLAGLINFSAGELEKAYQNLSAYVDRDSGNVIARKLLASTLLAMKQPGKAIPVLQAAINIAPDRADLQRLLGDAYLQAGQAAPAIQAFREADQLEPGRADVLAKMGVARLIADEREAAIRDMEAAIKQRPEAINTAAALTAAHLGAGNYQRALEVATGVLEQQPNNIAFHNLLAAAQANLGDFAAARASYDKALSLDPDFRPAQINLAHLDMREGRADAATKRLKGLLQKSPENTRLLFELAKLEQAQGHPDQALRLLEKINQINPRAMYPALRLIELRIQQGWTGAALQTAQLLKSTYPEDLQVLEMTGRAYWANGEQEQARAEFRRMSGLAGYNTGHLKSIANWQLRINALDDARWTLQKAVDGAPDDLSALASLAELQVRTGQFEDAAQLIDTLRRLHPDDLTGTLLSGDLALRQGKPQAAEQAYREVAKQVDNDEIALRLFRAVAAQNESDRAVKQLEAWVQSHPGSYAAKLALAETLHAGGELDAAKAYYEALLRQGPGSPALLNNLANLYLEVGDPQALKLALEAYQRAPQVAEVIDTLGWALVRTGDPQKGLGYLRDASSRNASSSMIRYHLAVALQELGRDSEAKAHFREALKGEGDFPQRADAEQRLQLMGGL